MYLGQGGRAGAVDRAMASREAVLRPRVAACFRLSATHQSKKHPSLKGSLMAGVSRASSALSLGVPTGVMGCGRAGVWA